MSPRINLRSEWFPEGRTDAFIHTDVHKISKQEQMIYSLNLFNQEKKMNRAYVM